MNFDRFHDPHPPVAGESERQAVRHRARRIRHQQRLRLILPTAVVAAAVVGVAIPLAGLHSVPGSLHPAGQSTTTTTTGVVPCASHSNLTRTPRTGRSVFDKNGVRFEYPSCWTAATYEEETTFSNSLVYLSNQTMYPPCTTTTFRGGSSVRSITCHPPLTRLAPDGILVQWSADGSPLWDLDKQPGTSLTVGGRPAREQIRGRSMLRSTICGSIGADESISVVVAQTVADNYYDMTACLRGPDTVAALARVRAMLASTTFADQ